MSVIFLLLSLQMWHDHCYRHYHHTAIIVKHSDTIASCDFAQLFIQRGDQLFLYPLIVASFSGRDNGCRSLRIAAVGAVRLFSSSATCCATTLTLSSSNRAAPSPFDYFLDSQLGRANPQRASRPDRHYVVRLSAPAIKSSEAARRTWRHWNVRDTERS